MFGGVLDDDIIGTAGRLAMEEGDDEEGAMIEALHVIEIPMSQPIDAPVPAERLTPRAQDPRARQGGRRGIPRGRSGDRHRARAIDR